MKTWNNGFLNLYMCFEEEEHRVLDRSLQGQINLNKFPNQPPNLLGIFFIYHIQRKAMCLNSYWGRAKINLMKREVWRPLL
uniref:Uncharacterized protein n=1 Tax=Manihot esculenta TaxID=3983 RepID=A0A2C9UMB5_MANES